MAGYLDTGGNLRIRLLQSQLYTRIYLGLGAPGYRILCPWHIRQKKALKEQ
jgi:hypothetical protein